MTTFFISDLHLDACRPEATQAFVDFVRHEATGAEALFILGDLFEAWVGDDDPSQPGAVVAQTLRELSEGGTPVRFMRGNRDFLLGEAYARRCGMQLLPDPCVVTLYGRATLLMHGDLLCTEDTSYQAFRRQVRDPVWQGQFLAQPLQARQAFAARARAASQQHHESLDGRGQAEQITDVSPATVESVLLRFGVDLLIHGHTHRPAVHRLDLQGRERTRVVLGDWYEQGSVLRLDADGFSLDTLELGAAAASS